MSAGRGAFTFNTIDAAHAVAASTIEATAAT
jgi:hypothetical protein